MVATWRSSDDEPIRAMSLHDHSINERPTLPEAIARETVVDQRPSFFARVGAWIASIAGNAAMAMRRPRLTDHLPPVPIRNTGEITHASATIGNASARAERMLLDVMSAPPEYLDAAILIVRATRELRTRGHDVFAEGFVAFVLSRMPPDADGTIQIKRLRGHVHDIPAAKGIVPVLLRLEEQGVVSLEAPLDDAVISGMSDMDQMRVRLLVIQ